MPALRKTRARKAAPSPKRHPRRNGLSKGTRRAFKIGLPTLALAGLIGAGTWVTLNGTAERLTAEAQNIALSLSARAGLRVEHVLITGRKRVGRDEAIRALRATRGMAILAFEPFAAKTRLEALSWVRAATVERRLPDTIFVRLAEREPLALWQAGKRLALIDREGVVITRKHLGRYRTLPLVVGTNAAAHAEALIEILRARPVVADATGAAIRIGARRWDLKLKRGVIAQLPEKGTARAVARLAELIAREQILDRNVVAIDLRLSDRLVVRTAPKSQMRTAPHAKTRTAPRTKTRATPVTKIRARQRPGKDT
jgi:cell division protein FtsQ